jgi:tetraacyldisaccharide-1-P 4'-kinase
LNRADVVGFNGVRGTDQLDVLTRWLADAAGRDIPTFGIGRDIELYDPSTDEEAGVEGTGIAAMSSIGRPGGFEASLLDKGLRIELALRFPDHHRYTTEDIETVNAEMAACGVKRIVTTEKDWVKLRELGGLNGEARVARLHLCVSGLDPVALCEKPRR